MKAKIKALAKKIPGLTEASHFLRNAKLDIHAIRAFREERKIDRTGPVKVVFLCQYIPAWTKTELLYQLMRDDPRFDPYLVCLPSGIKDNQLIDADSLENDTHQYFVEHGFPEAVNALIGKNTWLDLKAMEPAYVFYPRPYNSMMPSGYTTGEVSRFSKICLLMYGIDITDDLTATTLNRDFMAYVAYYFAENSCVRDANIRLNRAAHRLGLQNTLCVGMPVLESLCKKKEEISPSWDFSRSDFRVIWTPRWTTDLELGGSNFFTYYRELLRFADQHPEQDFLFRPHPLTFPHFIETGEMTEQEVAEFKAQCEAAPNVSIDTEQQYDATLWGSSVLISDYSGMVPEYFITGKPLIFCASNFILKLSEFGRQMMEGCYVVNNAEELFRCLLMLQSGEDPLREKRLKIIEEVYGSTNEHASARILDILAAGKE